MPFTYSTSSANSLFDLNDFSGSVRFFNQNGKIENKQLYLNGYLEKSEFNSLIPLPKKEKEDSTFARAEPCTPVVSVLDVYETTHHVIDWYRGITNQSTGQMVYIYSHTQHLYSETVHSTYEYFSCAYTPGSDAVYRSEYMRLQEVIDDRIDLDSSFESNDKINCTYNQLLKNTTVNALLDAFFGDDADYDLTFEVVPDLQCNGNSDAEGCTISSLGSNGSVTIQIDQDYVNSGQTPTLFLAQTIIHEAIHANMYLAVYNYNNGNTANLPDINDFPAIYEEYRQMNNWQHEFMANHYVNLIAQTLQDIHPLLNDQTFINSLADYDMSLNDFYTSIAYVGLNGTIAQTNYLSDSTNAENYNNSFYDAQANSTKTPNCN